MNGSFRGILAMAVLAAGCGAGGGDGGGAGGAGGSGETPDTGVGGEPVGGSGGQVTGGSGGEPVGGSGGAGGEPVGGSGGAGGEPVGGSGGAGGEPVGGSGGAGGEPVGGSGGAGGEPVGGSGGAGGEPVGGSGGAGGEPVGGSGGAGGGIVPPAACGAIDLNAGDAGDGTFVAAGTTVDAESASVGTCGGDLAPEVIFTFTAPLAGTWYFTTQIADLADSYDTLLYARTDCADPASELACDDDGADGPLSLLVLNLEAGATISVVVDGFRDRSGDFQLTAGLQTTLAIGEPCIEDDFASGCPVNSLCYSPDGGETVCTEIVTVDVGGECEPSSPVLICAEGLYCNDLDGDETFTCAEPVIVPEGGVCDPFAAGVDCAEGLVCFDPEEDGTFNCLAPLAAAEGEHCELFNFYYTCAEGLVCSDPEFTGMGNCVAPTLVEEGGACEPDSDVIICAQPAICMDALDDGNYTCVTLVTVEEGGECSPGNAAAVCVEGTGCVDLDGDGTHACTAPSPEFAACPAAFGEVAAIDTAGAAPWMIDVVTSMGMHHTNGTCGNGGDANDVAVTFTAPADGEYLAHMVGDFDTVLYAREYCSFPEDLACNDDDFEVGGSLIVVSLVAGQTIYLIADGYDEDASGAATITVEPAAVVR